MNKKLDLTKILLIAALIFIGWQSFFNDEPDPIPDPITITVPETTGNSGIVNIEPEIVRDTVYIKGDIVEVDKGYKELYEKAKDSLEKKELYLEAIQIKKYADTIVDNDEIMIKGKATTRGSLLDYSVDYTIKEKEVTYTPEVVSRFPKLSVGLGLEFGVPLMLDDPMVVKANLSIINRKGKEFGVSYDTNGTAWVGAKIIIKLRK
tara:strand:- start:27495 stop:28112 length:618 start_codon:yes stop_codon:yes gene_type:complete